MRYLLLILGLVTMNVAFAQHHQHTETKKPVEKKKTAPVKKTKPKATVKKDTASSTVKDTAKASHTHVLDDSTIITHDKEHNEIKKDSVHRHSMTDTIPHHRTHDSTGMPEQHMMHDTTACPGETDHENMSHAFSLHLPMNRNGSGTGWLPDASPMFGYMFHSPKWMFMLHGNVFLRYTNQDFTNKGSRGDAMLDVPNWVMFMGQRKLGNNGLFHFNTMFSLDAAIAGGKGYPLLFQSGELYKGQPLVDRQHPHDLFSELSASYAHSISAKTDVFVYLAYPGEPALGPVAFMHRPSALPNPDAPISHHWVDATHITFGVATLGIRSGKFKLEASSFTGREPDEDRYNFDKPLFDSWSGRLSFNPSEKWALQVSHAFLKSPETLHPNENLKRTTASAIYSHQLNKGSLNAAAIWGMNKRKGHQGENAFLLEGSWNVKKLTLHTRYEHVQKSVEELVLDESVYGHDAIFPVNAITAGFNYDLLNIGKTKIAAGSQFTWYSADKRLNSLYGKNPMAVEVYIRFYPSLMANMSRH